VKGVRGLKVGGGELGVMEAFVDGSKEFEGEFEPGFTGEDHVRSVKRGGKGLAGMAKAVKSDAGGMQVGDGVMVERVGDDDGGGLGIANQVSAEVLEGEELRRETGVGEGELIIHRVDVTHGGEVETELQGQQSKEK